MFCYHPSFYLCFLLPDFFRKYTEKWFICTPKFSRLLRTSFVSAITCLYRFWRIVFVVMHVANSTIRGIFSEVILSAGERGLLSFSWYINKKRLLMDERYSARSPFVILLSRRAQSARWSSFGKRSWFTESHTVWVIFASTCVLFTQFILDIK